VILWAVSEDESGECDAEGGEGALTSILPVRAEIMSGDQRRLAALRAEGEGVWRRIAALVATKKPAEYDRTVALLVDLREAGSEEEFGRRIRELRDEHRRKLMDRLDLAGL
jgi:hypothetical protein